MSLTLAEIKRHALEFVREHADDHDEKSQAQNFWRDFFAIWGITARKVGVFEERARTLKGTTGFIDFFWPGTLLIEHKSAGKDLAGALKQALDYCCSPDFPETALPRFILVCDFKMFRLLELGGRKTHEFTLQQLPEKLHLFNFILGYEQRTYKDEDPVNIKAAERMGAVYDGLKKSGYEGHPLQLFLVRLMFCFFADDTGIFKKDHLTLFLEAKTDTDGHNLGSQLAEVFQILNTPLEKRQKNLDEDLAEFPYVNGKLFEEALSIPSFDKALRDKLLACAHFDWSAVSPAIFGSLFQSVMDAELRRNLGAHYTSEKNILKTIYGLFLDDLREEFRKTCNMGKRQPLEKLLERIRNMRLLDPACGCGNFLILAYRELRLLEIDIHKAIQAIDHKKYLTLDFYRGIDVDNMYGIEIEEVPAQIARTALWIMDHIMNVRMSAEFGEYIIRLPLTATPHIVQGNALRMDWREVIAPEKLSYILGNPPFVGAKFLNEEQRKDTEHVFEGIDGGGLLDYVTCWYVKAASFLKESSARVAFVSTNSISQGEQVGILWSHLLSQGYKIDFAHRTFKWSNEAKGKAAVHVVIIGWGKGDSRSKCLYVYETFDAEPILLKADNINPYLVNSRDVIIRNRRDPICAVPRIKFGNQPIDGGFLILESEERKEAIKKEPKISSYIRRFLGSDEFINSIDRYCLWLKDVPPQILRESLFISGRLQGVKEFRLESKRSATKELAKTPSLFAFISHEEKPYLLIPSVSSEKRDYIPIGFMKPAVIASNLCLIIPGATSFHFGVLTSKMHNTWMRYTCGRLESRYRYSNSIVYNNYPWPEASTAAQKKAIEHAAHAVLDAREQFPDSSLADLYDPNTMPKVLTDAHRKLDAAVDKCYRAKPFGSELERIEYLFELYEKYTAGFMAEPKKTKRKKKNDNE
ncbi:MAG: DNA methyltransferase [Fibrobacterota bacterium]